MKTEKLQKVTGGSCIDENPEENEIQKKDTQIRKLRQWSGKLSGFANVLEGFSVVCLIFMAFMLWLGTKFSADLQGAIVRGMIKVSGQINFVFLRQWLPSAYKTFGGRPTFWILYVVILAGTVLMYYFYHEMHELAYNFTISDAPFTTESARRVRNMCVTFFLLGPSVISLLMMAVIIILFRYACMLQVESDETV